MSQAALTTLLHVVGAVLPEQGITYYDLPAEYHVTGYRYTYVNDHPVLA